MAKESLSGGYTIQALEVKIVEDSQHRQGLGRKASGDVMSLGEIAIAALHGGGGALIVGTHPAPPLHPPQDVSRLEGL